MSPSSGNKRDQGRPEFHRPPSTQSAVLAELRFWLTEGEFTPGSRLVVDQISARLNVSPVPVREALRILEGEGQVTYTQHRGYRVAEFSVDDLRENYRICDMLEADAIRVAVPLLDDTTVERIASHQTEAREAAENDQRTGWSRANRAFHFELFAACNRPVLLRTLDTLWFSSEPYQSMLANYEEHTRLSQTEHEVIMAAIRERDVEATVAAQSAHRASTLRVLETSIIEGTD